MPDIPNMPEGPQVPFDENGLAVLQNPHGEFERIDPKEVQQSLLAPEQGGGGYKIPSVQDVQAAQEATDYNTLLQEALGFAENALRNATFGTSTAAEIASGLTTGKDILAREKNQGFISNVLSSGLGLGAGALVPGMGEAEALKVLGQGAVDILGVGGTTALAKMSSLGTRLGVEAAALQGTDEFSKMLAKDPEQTMGTALINVGLAGTLAGTLGFGVGSVSPLWKATVGPKLTKALEAFKSRIDGNVSLDENPLVSGLNKIGIDPNTDMKAAFSSDPNLNTKFMDLVQARDTGASEQVQASLNDFRKQAVDSILETVGKTADDVPSLNMISKNDAGTDIKSALLNDFKSNYDGAVQGFDEAKLEYGASPFPASEKQIISNQLGSLNVLGGFTKRSNSPIGKFIQGIINDIPQQENLRDLINLRSNVLGEVFSREDLRGQGLYSKLKPIFESAENNLLDQAAGAKGREVFEGLQGAKAAYSAYMDEAAEVAKRLKIGKYSSAADFIKKLEAAKDENFVDRLSGKNDADWLKTVQESHIEAAQKIKDYQLSKLTQMAAHGARPGEALSPEKFIKGFERMTQDSPELSKFLMPPENAQKLSVLKDAFSKINSLPWNRSNSGPTFMRALSNMAMGPLGFISAMETHSPIAGLMLGGLSKYMTREVPDAMKLGLMRFMASDAPIDSSAFKTMVEMIDHARRGSNALSKAVQNVFEPGAAVLSPSLIKSQDTEKLEDYLEKLDKQPEALLNIGGKLGHYLPDHQSSLAQMGAATVMALSNAKPKEIKNAPLDSSIKPTQQQQSTYKNMLILAQQPLSVLPKIKDGTIAPQEIAFLKNNYPGVYSALAQKMSHEMINHIDKDGTIPYKTRMGLSLFLGQPLDSTMTPMGIQLHQTANKMNLAPSQQQSIIRPKRSSPALGKMSQSEMTAGQQAESRHLK